MKKIITLVMLSSASTLLANYYEYSNSNAQPYQSSYQNAQGYQNPYSRNQYQGNYYSTSTQTEPYSQERSAGYSSQSNQTNYSNSQTNQSQLSQMNQSQLSDRNIAQEIHNILSGGWLSSGYANVSYEIHNGTVTLKGSVATLDDKNKIEERLGKINGIKQIDNQISVVGKEKEAGNAYYNNANNMRNMDQKYSQDRMDASHKDNVSSMKSSGKSYPQDYAANDSDRLINTKIRDKFSGWFTNDYEEINLDTNNGVVTITGYVEKFGDIQKINDKLKDITGIKSINNQAVARDNK